jgi:RNA polymerase sigma-70 factor, ECF subfamily
LHRHIPSSSETALPRKPEPAAQGAPTSTSIHPAIPPLSDAEFKAELITLIPHLRAFAHSVARGPEAEDLAQETMLRAWKSRASFQPGTNFKGWIFTILRNEHYSRGRRSWRSQPLDPEIAENTLVANDDPTSREDLLDVRNAMQELSFEHRQALALVSAAGLSYLEAAAICDCAIGTVKSRVSRARVELAAILERRQLTQRARTGISSSQAFDAIMAETAEMQKPGAHAS